MPKPTFEQQIVSKIITQCYWDEYYDTPEEQRNDCSSDEERMIFEYLRLGGPLGNQTGIYPPQIVAEIFDKRARHIYPSELRKITLDSYKRDIELIKERSKEFPPIREYLRGCNGDTQRILILDLEEGTINPLRIPHYSSLEACIRMGKVFYPKWGRWYSNQITKYDDEEKIRENIHKRFIKGREHNFPRTERLTEGIETRVIFLETFAIPLITEEEITKINTNPFNSRILLFRVCRDLDIEEKGWFSKQHTWDEFTPNQRRIIEKERDKINGHYNKGIEQLKLLKRLFLIRPEIIFLTAYNQIIAYEEP